RYWNEGIQRQSIRKRDTITEANECSALRNDKIVSRTEENDGKKTFASYSEKQKDKISWKRDAILCKHCFRRWLGEGERPQCKQYKRQSKR
ncbi:MAG: hypothetical protein WCW40_13020, partial [Bacteroidota bacterium]